MKKISGKEFQPAELKCEFSRGQMKEEQDESGTDEEGETKRQDIVTRLEDAPLQHMRYHRQQKQGNAHVENSGVHCGHKDRPGEKRLCDFLAVGAFCALIKNAIGRVFFLVDFVASDDVVNQVPDAQLHGIDAGDVQVTLHDKIERVIEGL